jgi:hypothetical protein
MATVSISEAARLAGIARSSLYKYYIKTGKLSLSQNGGKRPVIDTSELLRVFGSISSIDTLDNTVTPERIQKVTDENCSLSSANEAQKLTDMAVMAETIKGQRTMLEQLQHENEWLRNLVSDLRNDVKQLTHQKIEPVAPAIEPSQARPWWKFWWR